MEMPAVVIMEKAVIVAVDDSREMLDILKSVIAGAGYRFFGASNAQQCMRLVRDVEPDLILLDVQMPETDGFDLCKQIRAIEAFAHTPVAFVTARRTAQDVKAGIAAGGNDFITKPFDAKNLMQRIERWVNQKQA
ncbi:MAG TPA: response regulator [Stellaceae bacterium]|jgi:DNA-binding response OmpR family regulator|nr:response regulator [Stellaceae bacterium]